MANKSYTFDFSKEKSFKDISSTSNFVKKYAGGWFDYFGNNRKKNTTTIEIDIPVNYTKTHSNYNKTWVDDIYPNNNRSYSYAKVYDISEIFEIMTSTNDDYEFYDSYGNKVEVFDGFIKIGYNIYPTKKFTKFHFNKPETNKKNITIEFIVK